jgi:hypothetical protein
MEEMLRQEEEETKKNAMRIEEWFCDMETK